jgi:hypothetical protein
VSTHADVTITNGDRLSCSGRCSDLAIDIADETFHITCYGMSLGSFDMVVVVKCLESLGPILWDFRRHTLVFVRDGRRIVWTASSRADPPTTLAAISDDIMEELLHFVGLFAAPMGLPPERTRSHRIRLEPGTSTLAVRPYRYAHT